MYATVQELVDALTPEEKIGQLFIIRPDALDLTLPQETINDAKADGVTMLTDAMRETLQAYQVSLHMLVSIHSPHTRGDQ